MFPIFVGSGRSGTTLVQAIFSAHPDLAITHESQFIPRLANRPYTSSDGFDVDAFLRDLNRVPDFVRLEIDEQELMQRLHRHPPSGYADAVRSVFAQYASQTGKVRYGDKSPGYVLHMELLADLFPEARFIHVVRDGRAVALSYVETKFGPKDVPAGALYWDRRVTKGREYGRALGPERYRELRYEDLVEAPESTVKELAPFLEIDFDPAMLRYFERGEELRSQTADPSAHQSLSRPPTKGLRDWRTEMTDQDAAIFEVLAGSTLEAFGYEVSGRRPSPATLAGAAAAWAQWQGQRAAAFGRSAVKRVRRRLR